MVLQRPPVRLHVRQRRRADGVRQRLPRRQQQPGKQIRFGQGLQSCCRRELAIKSSVAQLSAGQYNRAAFDGLQVHLG